MALSYGTKELAAAKKWKQESENEPNESIKNITAKVESDDSISCKLCVACEETIPENAKSCPKCGWTEPA